MTSLIDTHVARYNDLTQRLEDIVPEIASAEEEMTQRRLTASSERKRLESIGDLLVEAAIARAGGIKEFGSNDDLRKKASARVKAQDRRYAQQEGICEACDIDVLRQEDLLSDLNRRYSAIGHQIVHHAALMQLLASAGAGGSGAAPVTADIVFPGPTPKGFLPSAEAITPAEAAAIGL